MIEQLATNNEDSFSKLALLLYRYKKRGYNVVGLGYPFFYYEHLSLIKLCDFFVDDLCDPSIEKWNSNYDIKDINDLSPLKEAVILVFSFNRHSLLLNIQRLFPHFEIVYCFNVNNNFDFFTSEGEFENSKLFTYRRQYLSKISIENAIMAKKGSVLSNMSNHLLKIKYLEMYEKSELRISSRFENYIDSLIMSNKTSLHVLLDGRIHIRNCYLSERTKINVYSGEIDIQDVYFGENCTIHVYNQLTIGSGTIISWNVTILDGDGHTLSVNGKQNRPKSISIGDHVWIGNDVTILKGVNIGSGSVVGAGSVVTKSIPDNSLAVGNPAKVISHDAKWEYPYNFTFNGNKVEID